jgi:hypothetical protein
MIILQDMAQISLRSSANCAIAEFKPVIELRDPRELANLLAKLIHLLHNRQANLPILIK